MVIFVLRMAEERDEGNGRPQKTLVVYSGPTSMDRLQGKNGMYIDNMNYFLNHGVSCFDGVPNKDNAEHVVVNYIFVLTQEVADYYTSSNGPVRKKMEECKLEGQENGLINVVTRRDRCYDMESIRTVVTQMNVQALYDNLLFINCGLVGPKLGLGTPKSIPLTQTNRPNSKQMMHWTHWSQMYTSMLSDSVKLVGHSINTHFHTFTPHVQSFLFSLKMDTVPTLLSSGAIYDCGLTQEELGSDADKRLELIRRYEVGMSTELLERGYSIGTPFVNRYAFGKSLVFDKNTTLGTDIDDTVSDIWYEDGIRNLTATQTIRSWDYFVFFKVSRFVPEDIQHEMQYNRNELAKNDIPVVSNNPRKLFSKYWLRKSVAYVDTGNTLLDSFWKIACLVFLGLFTKKKRLRHFKRV